MLSKYVAPVKLKKWLSDSLLIFFSKFIISLATTQRFLMAKRELLSISPCLSKYAATVTQKKPLSDGFFFLNKLTLFGDHVLMLERRMETSKKGALEASSSRSPL